MVSEVELVMRQLEARNQALMETAGTLEEENRRLLMFVSILLHKCCGCEEKILVKDFERMLADGWTLGVQQAELENEKGYVITNVRPR